MAPYNDQGANTEVYGVQDIFSAVVTDFAPVFCKSVGLGFLVSAWAKLRDIESFRAICAGYPGAARFGLRTTSSLILSGEFAIGAALLAPHDGSSRFALAAALLWTAATTAAVAGRRLRGERKFRCGCGTDLSEESSALWLLVRNVLIAAGLLAAAAGGDLRATAPLDSIPQTMAAVGLLLGIQLLKTAISTLRRVREWRTAG